MDKSKQLIATVQVTSDVIALYMLACRYKKSFLSFLALYELYGRDVFVFFYILGSPADEDCFMGKTMKELVLPSEIKDKDIPTDASLKLIKTRAKKIADAIRRKSPGNLTDSNRTMYNEIMKLCEKPKEGADPREFVINFYSNKLEPVDGK